MAKKTLYLARHAKSSWKDLSLSDFDRPLNARGERDAPMMAEILAKKGLKPQLILSSPALRAKDTARYYHQALGGELRFEPEIYDASAQSLYYLLLEAFESFHRVMVIGHNPAVTELNNILSDEPIYNIPTAATVGIVFEGKVEPQNGKQLFFEYPKMYTGEEGME